MWLMRRPEIMKAAQLEEACPPAFCLLFSEGA